MKKFILAGIAALFVAAQAFAAAVVEQHDLRVELVPEQNLIQATDRLTVRPDGASRLLLTLTPTAEILDVTADGRQVPWSFQRGHLGIELPTGERVSVGIRYRAKFTDQAPARPLNTEDPGFGVTGAIGPEGVFLGGEAGWYPEDRESQPTFRLQIDTPLGMSAVTAGRRIANEPGRSVWQVEHPVRGLALAAGPYQVRSGEAGDVPVYAYFYPQSRQFAETYLQAAQNYIEMYRQLFGPYPFAKFAVTENFFPTGYGYPSWTLLGSSVVALPFIVETSLGHEVAHSWWGNGVWVDYAQGNWSEGLTTYVADHLYKARQSPEEARQYRLKILRDYAALVPPDKDFPLADFISRTTAAEQAVGYGKAAMVFHMARQRVGDAAFWEGLRRVAGEKLFARASWRDFAEALEQTGGNDLQPFFRQWVQRPGAPQLVLTEVRAEPNASGWTVTGVLRQQPPVYDLQMPLLLETEDGSITAIIAAGDETTPFRLAASGRPLRLIADPEVDVFRRLAWSEIPPTVNGVRGSGNLLAIAAADLPAATLESARQILPALGRKTTNIRSEQEVSPTELQGRDVLFIGLPTREELRPILPAGLTLSATEFVLEGEAYAGEDAVLFATLPQAKEPQRTTALFLPGSAKAAATAARKIPHYGKYSYLAFVNGTNVAKGIWPAPSTPMVHTFAPPTEQIQGEQR
ncbi:MAG: M1 family aminopeptidase [Desulfuromonadales bacterium]|jgi:hypothetical protein